ncbi:hypothetical protein RhiirA5_453024 [Rhizophagus irregularis]|jgi:hypothetical protein|uniref:Arrestin-like N-terminal domain-containing protein n=3 Tax=Rhizophagus irregularis TaxID=588596 RepID=U9TSW3_RHIID|nr:hypothetical protein GLOIN_2v1762360 [Rhizophagus irregularis DAOM 181602=DAOM 197198]EXX75849.1 hypothetical protein RirG_038220 [Rhizophagus irregularis DAOM 197198w]PKC02829.1 hypothetical protein RhiirA5_453024 [Rhizophagus irregularis]PKC73881.1 hypothetical protein RhiirA1_388571 [Rhizophagus irregularis]PKK80703.1 hypothetical protein RhiirC2_767786 [Rhizophagus irregularis]PKY14258.1 hypothetical protein RhiirB3_379943 [Rhizophagus irregularis]|eukprot:XP_025189033.1 hypothetical protein GLOIN_2v1762360 [Rhizophagus irregularis DAOM 181602=DAOM 197198]
MAAMRPSLQLLGTSSSKCFFSYHYNMKTFQIGYLGIGPSRISGGFHLRYPTSSPIHISKITATLIGQESVTFIFHDDVQNKKNIFYSQTQCIYNSSSSSNYTPITSLDLNFDFKLDDDIPPSYSSSSQVNNIPFSQDIIKYKIVITIFRKCNIFKLQGKNKIVSTICQIDRYSLPSVIKSRNTGGLLMYRTDSNKVSPNSKLDLVQAEALLTSEYIDMNSIMVIPLSLDLPDSIMKIEKIYVVIKEYQTFKEFGRDKEIVYFNDSQKILDYTLLGEEIEITKFINNKCLIELKLDIPAFDCTNNKFQAFEGVRIMKYFNVRHVLKIKIKFENEGQLVLKRDVWLQRSLSEKKILKGRENGSIY